ncbi:hypothetical protein CSA37_11815 [Candidatus Fermentibacteria bacterium]|nr:MAG: hypothetical protein CSA37_11815 [Candidatus Fermentibacteria bacterium]
MAFIFGSKAQRTFRKIQDLASSDMVDQAAVMIEEELDNLLEDHEVAGKLVPFLMDIGHPDLGGRIGEKVIRKHSDLRVSVTRLLEEKQSQFPRSIELLRVIWKSRLHQRDFNGLFDLLSRTDRVTVNRFADSVQSSWQALNGVKGRELGAGIDRILAWSVISFNKGQTRESMDILVDAAERCHFPEESLSRLSGWIASRTGGTDMEVNLRRVRILVAIGDRERAIAELPSLYEAEDNILSQAVSLVEKELVPGDTTSRATISLARLMSHAGRVNEACLILESLVDSGKGSNQLEQAVTGIVLHAQGSARVHLLQARLRLARGENTQALDSIERAFQCEDIADSPVVDICMSFIDSGVDRDGLITGKLGEFLVEQGSVSEAVQILVYSVSRDPEWVLEKLQALLKRDRSSAAVLTLVAVVLLVLSRVGEAAATLKHLASRKDIKSKQDIYSVLSYFDYLMEEHPELRRLRASCGSRGGADSGSASDWLELVLSGDKISEEGYLSIFDSGIIKNRAEDLLKSGFEPTTPVSNLLYAEAIFNSGEVENSGKLLERAMESPELVDRVTGIVSAMPFSVLSKIEPAETLSTLNRYGRGELVAKLLPLLAMRSVEPWMDQLASEVVLGTNERTVMFRLRYFIDSGRPGTGAAAVKGIDSGVPSIDRLVEGCSAAAAGDRDRATDALSQAADSESTAPLAKAVLSMLLEENKGTTLGTIALARADLNTGNATGARVTLMPVLDKIEVLNFLEEAVADLPASHELQGCLALARLYSGNPEGYREAAGTAAEGNSGVIKELVEKGARYSIAAGDSEGMIFAAELGGKYLEDFDPSELCIRALCLNPSLHQRIGLETSTDPVLVMLISLASENAESFKEETMPEWVSLPISIVSSARETWSAQNSTDALVELEKLAIQIDSSREIHLIRMALASSGLNRSSELLSDAEADSSLRKDFFELCSEKETAGAAMERLFPFGITAAEKTEVDLLTSMLVRCGAQDKLFDLAEMLLGSEDGKYREAASEIVEMFIPTAGEEGYLSVEQVVKLLIKAGRLSDAFFMARGNSELLQIVRAVRDEADASGKTPEGLIQSGKAAEAVSLAAKSGSPMRFGDILWKTGDRIAACGVWRKAWSSTGDPSYLVRMVHAMDSMGKPRDAEAIRRILADKHPELLHTTGKPINNNNNLVMIEFSLL